MAASLQTATIAWRSPGRGLPAANFDRFEFGALCLLFTLLQTGLGGAAGTAVVAVELSIFVLLLAARWNRGVDRLVLFLPLLAYPVFTVISTIWSLAPQVTLRYSLELLLTCYAGVYLGLFRRPPEILKVFFISTALGLLLSVASHRQGPSATGMVLVGLVGSKNAMASLAQWTAMSALAVLLLPKCSIVLRLAALLILAPACYITLHLQAAGAALSLYIGFALLLGLYGLSRSPTPIRFLAAAIVVGSVLMALLLKDVWMPSAQDFMIHVLHKDMTLTGRTVLWDYAREFMARRPLLGRGYKEIWIGGTVDTQGLLRFARILDGRGFYFHETYLDAGVDCGYVGVLILVLTFGFLAAALSWRFLKSPSVSLAYLSAMFALLMMKSFGETLMQPLSAYCALLYCSGVVVIAGARRAQAPPIRSTADPHD